MKAMNDMTLAPPGKAFERRRAERKLSKLRKRLFEASLPEVGDPAKLRLFRLAAGEAEALASLTPCPLLVLPELLHEKLATTDRYVRRQTRSLTHEIVVRGHSLRRIETAMAMPRMELSHPASIPPITEACWPMGSKTAVQEVKEATSAQGEAPVSR